LRILHVGVGGTGAGANAKHWAEVVHWTHMLVWVLHCVKPATAVHSAEVVHCTHVLVWVLHCVKPATVHWVSITHATHLLTLAVSATVLHCVVVDPVTIQAALSVAVHWTQRLVTVLHTGVVDEEEHCVVAMHSASMRQAYFISSYRSKQGKSSLVNL
jgi:hypothetical protein